ncbi:hypothetical protein Tco_0126686 [Tanacetum coccineum]
MMPFPEISFSVTLHASSSSKSSSTKGDVLEGGGVSSNVTLSDSSTFLVQAQIPEVSIYPFQPCYLIEECRGAREVMK